MTAELLADEERRPAIVSYADTKQAAEVWRPNSLVSSFGCLSCRTNADLRRRVQEQLCRQGRSDGCHNRVPEWASTNRTSELVIHAALPKSRGVLPGSRPRRLRVERRAALILAFVCGSLHVRLLLRARLPDVAVLIVSFAALARRTLAEKAGCKVTPHHPDLLSTRPRETVDSRRRSFDYAERITRGQLVARFVHRARDRSDRRSTDDPLRRNQSVRMSTLVRHSATWLTDRSPAAFAISAHRPNVQLNDSARRPMPNARRYSVSSMSFNPAAREPLVACIPSCSQATS